MLYLISFQVTTKTIFTKHYKIARVAPSLKGSWFEFNLQHAQFALKILKILNLMHIFVAFLQEVLFSKRI